MANTKRLGFSFFLAAAITGAVGCAEGPDALEDESFLGAEDASLPPAAPSTGTNPPPSSTLADASINTSYNMPDATSYISSAWGPDASSSSSSSSGNPSDPLGGLVSSFTSVFGSLGIPGIGGTDAGTP